MLEYQSSLTITIRYPENPNKILEALRAFDPFLTHSGDLNINITIATIGSPNIGSPNFRDMAVAIWWANGYTEIEFLITQSTLKYSSPNKFADDEYKAWINDIPAKNCNEP
jgi:hypothetical protein